MRVEKLTRPQATHELELSLFPTQVAEAVLFWRIFNNLQVTWDQVDERPAQTHTLSRPLYSALFISLFLPDCILCDWYALIKISQ